MKPYYTIARHSLLFALAGLLFSGCTFVGFGIGAAIDSKQPKKEKNIQGWELVSLKHNSRITVFRKEEGPMTGIYRGVVKMNPRKDSLPNAIVLDAKGGSGRFEYYQIPFERIDHVYVPARKITGKIIGPIIGLALDALIIIGINSADYNLGTPCPFVYSYDGSKYQLDAEMCTGAFYKAAQFADRAVLARLRAADDGMYRIRIANEVQETDFIDQLSLLMFEHPKISAVYYSSSGRYVALSKPVSPRSARTSKEGDVTALMDDSKEETYWTANPFGRNPESEADLRENLDLVFDRPRDAAHAALLLNLRNTAWVAGHYHALMTMQGRALSKWFAQLNSDENARNQLNTALLRENGLSVRVWDRTQWRLVATVNIVGPVTDRAVVQELDLRDIPGETLHIRLDCPPGYWMVRSAEVDFSYEECIAARELFPVKALAQSGEEVTDLLAKTDGVCHTMPAAGDYAEMEFACPPLGSGLERTVMVQCTGYYTPHIEPKGEPQTGLMNRLLQEPGAFNRWRLKTLNDEVGSVLR